jgi:hypothetical protein
MNNSILDSAPLLPLRKLALRRETVLRLGPPDAPAEKESTAQCDANHNGKLNTNPEPSVRCVDARSQPHTNDGCGETYRACQRRC